MPRPLIGVMPLYDEEKESIWMLPGYLDGLKAAGGIPVILPLNLGEDEFAQIAGLYDGFLFTGGHDISPLMYHEAPIPQCGTACHARDELERMVFHYCLEKDIPILGICRGIQIINVLMGGTLYQDLPSQYAGTTPGGRHIEHHMHPPYDQVQHWNTLCPGSPLHSLLQKDRLGVNSYHHQAIKDPGHDIRVMAMSEDGLIEGIYVPDRSFIWGIQWHPEFSCQNDEDSLKIFRAFICACS